MILRKPTPFLGLVCVSGSLASGAASGCAGPLPAERYEADLSVVGDPGKPVPDATITLDGSAIARSDGAGKLTLALHGREGQVFAFQVVCPEGYRSPSQPLSIVLRRLTEEDKRPQYEVRCQPLLRTVVVAIRAEQGAHLPVLYLDREVARTDSFGAAHFMVKASPEDAIELTLDTSALPDLRPRNPSARFQVAPRDDYYVFNQVFHLPPRPKPAPIRRVGIVNLGAR